MELIGIMEAMRSMCATAKFLLLLAAASSVLLGSNSAHAARGDPAAIQVQTLTDALLKSMRAGSSRAGEARDSGTPRISLGRWGRASSMERDVLTCTSPKAGR